MWAALKETRMVGCWDALSADWMAAQLAEWWALQKVEKRESHWAAQMAIRRADCLVECWVA